MNSKMHSAGRAPGSSTRSLRTAARVDEDDLAGLDLAHEAAPMMSRAQVSLAMMGSPSRSPRQSGRTP